MSHTELKATLCFSLSFLFDFLLLSFVSKAKCQCQFSVCKIDLIPSHYFVICSSESWSRAPLIRLPISVLWLWITIALKWKPDLIEQLFSGFLLLRVSNKLTPTCQHACHIFNKKVLITEENTDYINSEPIDKIYEADTYGKICIKCMDL